MNSNELETKALRIVDTFIKGRSEDSFVEFKSLWTDPKRAARQIAAHANEASPDDILWIIGVDEGNRCVVDPGNVEPADWWSKVRSNFVDSCYPEMRSVGFVYDGKNLCALAFETDRAPYMVRNDKGENIIPWRRGTACETATRSNLLLLFSKRPKLAECDVFSAKLDAGPSRNEETRDRSLWAATIEIYVKIPDSTSLHIPIREITIALTDPRDGSIFLSFDTLDPWRAEPGAVAVSPSQITINHTGAFTLRATSFHPVNETSPGLLKIQVNLPVVEYGGRLLQVSCNVQQIRPSRTGVSEIQGRKFQSQYSYDMLKL